MKRCRGGGEIVYKRWRLQAWAQPTYKSVVIQPIATQSGCKETCGGYWTKFYQNCNNNAL